MNDSTINPLPFAQQSLPPIETTNDPVKWIQKHDPQTITFIRVKPSTEKPVVSGNTWTGKISCTIIRKGSAQELPPLKYEVIMPAGLSEGERQEVFDRATQIYCRSIENTYHPEKRDKAVAVTNLMKNGSLQLSGLSENRRARVKRGAKEIIVPETKGERIWRVLKHHAKGAGLILGAIPAAVLIFPLFMKSVQRTYGNYFSLQQPESTVLRPATINSSARANWLNSVPTSLKGLATRQKQIDKLEMQTRSPDKEQVYLYLLYKQDLELKKTRPSDESNELGAWQQLKFNHERLVKGIIYNSKYLESTSGDWTVDALLFFLHFETDKAPYRIELENNLTTLNEMLERMKSGESAVTPLVEAYFAYEIDPSIDPTSNTPVREPLPAELPRMVEDEEEPIEDPPEEPRESELQGGTTSPTGEVELDKSGVLNAAQMNRQLAALYGASGADVDESIQQFVHQQDQYNELMALENKHFDQQALAVEWTLFLLKHDQNASSLRTLEYEENLTKLIDVSGEMTTKNVNDGRQDKPITYPYVQEYIDKLMADPTTQIAEEEALIRSSHGEELEEPSEEPPALPSEPPPSLPDAQLQSTAASSTEAELAIAKQSEGLSATPTLSELPQEAVAPAAAIRQQELKSGQLTRMAEQVRAQFLPKIIAATEMDDVTREQLIIALETFTLLKERTQARPEQLSSLRETVVELEIGLMREVDRLQPTASNDPEKPSQNLKALMDQVKDNDDDQTIKIPAESYPEFVKVFKARLMMTLYGPNRTRGSTPVKQAAQLYQLWKTHPALGQEIDPTTVKGGSPGRSYENDPTLKFLLDQVKKVDDGITGYKDAWMANDDNVVAKWAIIEAIETGRSFALAIHQARLLLSDPGIKDRFFGNNPQHRTDIGRFIALLQNLESTQLRIQLALERASSTATNRQELEGQIAHIYAHTPELPSFMKQVHDLSIQLRQPLGTININNRRNPIKWQSPFKSLTTMTDTSFLSILITQRGSRGKLAFMDMLAAEKKAQPEKEFSNITGLIAYFKNIGDSAQRSEQIAAQLGAISATIGANPRKEYKILNNYFDYTKLSDEEKIKLRKTLENDFLQHSNLDGLNALYQLRSLESLDEDVPRLREYFILALTRHLKSQQNIPKRGANQALVALKNNINQGITDNSAQYQALRSHFSTVTDPDGLKFFNALVDQQLKPIDQTLEFLRKSAANVQDQELNRRLLAIPVISASSTKEEIDTFRKENIDELLAALKEVRVTVPEGLINNAALNKILSDVFGK